MPLRWKGAPTPPSAFQVLEIKINQPRIVVVGHDREAHVVKDLHWLPAQARTVPCLEEDCPWHHLPIRETIYAPCLYDAGERRWKIGIISFTEKQRLFLEGDFAGKIFKFERVGRYNGPVRWFPMEYLNPCTMPVPSIDVKPSLLRMWGEYTNYKIVGPKVDIKLFDDAGPRATEGRAS